jgi:hypothetical protein
VGAPLRGRAGASAPPPPEPEDAIARLLDELVFAAGELSPDEARLLLAIVRRLERLERDRGPQAAREAADRIRQIWLQAIDEDEALSAWFRRT